MFVASIVGWLFGWLVVKVHSKLWQSLILRGSLQVKRFFLMIWLPWRIHSKSSHFSHISDILQGSVSLFNNYNLCHVRSINWTEIMSDPDAKYFYTYNFTQPQRTCHCHESCKGGCWGEGSENCQKFSKVTCSPQCHDGRCYGPGPRDCCHLFCAGGCAGPTQRDCLVRYSISA